MTFYKIDFACNDQDSLQSKLNHLYGYQNVISTKVLHRNRLNLFYILMNQLIAKGMIVSFESALDIGCSAGTYSKIISDFGFHYVLGIDISQEIIETANEHFAFNEEGRILEFKAMKAEDLDTTRKFDFILCTEVIEHTENPTLVIQKIKDILAPEGLAIISLPNKISLPWYILFLIRKITRQPIDQVLQDHLNYPFYKSIKLFKDNNIEVIETSGTNLILNSIFLRIAYQTSLFPLINKVNFALSRWWPLKYFTQFFFIILQKKGASS